MKWALFIFVALTGLCTWIYSITRDTDVSSSPKYGFASFSGTVWRTKVKLATGHLEGHTRLIPPIFFDKTDPRYLALPDLRELSILPIGSRVRIDRLIQDNGSWGGIQVTAMVDDGTGIERKVYLNTQLLAPNSFLDAIASSSKTWAVNSDMLGK